MNAFDQLVAAALPLAAAYLDLHAEAPSFREEYLEQAFVEAVRRARPGATAEATGRARVAIPNWDRPLGGFDLRLRLGDGHEGEALVEAKVDDVDQTLWDLLKLAAALSEPGVEAGYLLLARHRHRWDDGDCTALFAASARPIRWDVAAMFDEWSAAWASLLRGGAARPISVPAEIETAFIGRSPAAGFDPYEIRCVGVRLARDAGALRFDGDWPVSGRPD